MGELPDPALVVLVGAAGSGKSHWASSRYRTAEVVSSDTGPPDALLWVGVAGLLLGLLAVGVVARGARRRQHP